MPADGEELLALVAGCAAAADGAGSAKRLKAAADGYFGRVVSLRKNSKAGEGSFSAADAKREGALMVKIVNSSLKQQVPTALPALPSACVPVCRSPRVPSSACRRIDCVGASW